MKDYKASYLQPEDRQLFTAVVLYRNEIGDGFPITRSISVSLSPDQGGRFDTDPIEEFDLADSVTSVEHALNFAKFALRVRQSVTHTIEFNTTVNEVLGVTPGAYIKVTTESHYHPYNDNTSQRFKNGSIGSEGQVTCNSDLKNTTVNIFYWQSGDRRQCPRVYGNRQDRPHHPSQPVPPYSPSMRPTSRPGCIASTR